MSGSVGWLPRDSRVRALARTISIGLPSGVLAGLGAYILSQPSLTPVSGTTPPLALVVLGGAFVPLLSDRLRRSVAAMLCAYATGIAVHLGAYVAPLWVLSYPPTARDLLLPRFLAEALTVVFFQYTLAFFAGYLLVTTVSGYLGA
jgi:hypothetical protein